MFQIITENKIFYTADKPNYVKKEIDGGIVIPENIWIERILASTRKIEEVPASLKEKVKEELEEIKKTGGD